MVFELENPIFASTNPPRGARRSGGYERNMNSTRKKKKYHTQQLERSFLRHRPQQPANGTQQQLPVFRWCSDSLSLTFVLTAKPGRVSLLVVVLR